MGSWLGLGLGVPPAGQYWATTYSQVHLVDLSLDLSIPVPSGSRLPADYRAQLYMTMEH